MRLERSKNLIINLKWGLIYRFSGILIPFVCKAAIIRIFGINYLGLNSLFASIISTLNLAELGFHGAVVFFMYKEIAEENSENICALLNYFRRVYRIIGTIILVAGLALIPFLQFLIKKDIPEDINIYIIYILTLSATVVSYFLFAYKNSILTAFQRESILYKIRAAVLIVESIAQIITIFVLRNFYVYTFVSVVAAAMNNLLADYYVRKHYPEYKPKGTLSKNNRRQIGEKIKGLIYYKIGGVIVGSADSIVISAFLGLAISGIYGNYYYVLNLLFGILAIYYTSFRAGLGNSFVTETVEKNYETFTQLQFMQSWIIGFCTISMFCLYQDFIAIYAGEENVLEIGIAICMCLYLYCWKMQDIVHVFKEACGYWTKDRFRPLIGALMNLCLNIITVQIIGLYGVILSTVVEAVTIDLIWAPKAIFHEYFKRSRKDYYILLCKCVLDLICMALPTILIVKFVSFESHFINLLVKAVICVIVPNAVFIIKNRNKREFRSIKYRLVGLTRKI